MPKYKNLYQSPKMTGLTPTLRLGQNRLRGYAPVGMHYKGPYILA